MSKWLRVGAQESAAHTRAKARAVHLVGAGIAAGGAQSAVAVRRVAAPRLGPNARQSHVHRGGTHIIQNSCILYHFSGASSCTFSINDVLFSVQVQHMYCFCMRSCSSGRRGSSRSCSTGRRSSRVTRKSPFSARTSTSSRRRATSWTSWWPSTARPPDPTTSSGLQCHPPPQRLHSRRALELGSSQYLSL